MALIHLQSFYFCTKMHVNNMGTFVRKWGHYLEGRSVLSILVPRLAVKTHQRLSSFAGAEVATVHADQPCQKPTVGGGWSTISRLTREERERERGGVEAREDDGRERLARWLAGEKNGEGWVDWGRKRREKKREGKWAGLSPCGRPLLDPFCPFFLKISILPQTFLNC